MKHLGGIAREWLDLRGPEDERPQDLSERISEEHLRAIIGRDSRSPDTGFKSDPEYAQACEDRHTLLSEVLSLRSRLRWVAVTECLPMDMCTVLVWITGPETVTCEEPFVEIGAYNPERGNWQCYLYGEERDVEVSHWMALPPYPDIPATRRTSL
jgi:hypothetical protein